MKEYPYLTKTPESEGEWFHALAQLARFLRGPNGCPWDQEQTSKDFAEFAAEEAQELVDAVRAGDSSHMEEEVGDTLFCLLATVAAAEAEGRFTLEGALQRIHEKMIRRHDHVFGETKAATPEEAIAAWNRAKSAEKSGDTE